MGTSSSEDTLDSLKTDVGKTRYDILSTYYQSKFPMSTEADVRGVFERLNLTGVGLQDLFTLVAPPVSCEARDSDKLPLVEQVRVILEDYVVGARFRLVAGTIKQIATALVIKENVGSGLGAAIKLAKAQKKMGPDIEEAIDRISE